MTKPEKIILASTSVVMCFSLLIDATLWPISTFTGTLTFITLIFSACLMFIAVLMTKRYDMRLLLMMIVVLTAGFLGWGLNKWKENRFHKVVKEVRALGAALHGARTQEQIIIHGKVLVWDLDDNSLSSAEDHLPSRLRASFPTKRMTIFLIMPGSDQAKVGTYSLTGSPAIRQFVNVCAVYWPEGTLAGWNLVSVEPPQSKTFHYSPGSGSMIGGGEPGYGDIEKSISTWISTLPIAN